MAENLKHIINQQNSLIPSIKVLSNIQQFGTQAVNKSYEATDSEDDSSLGGEELLKMQIKQLKRENNFLKSKIQDLKAGKRVNKTMVNKKKSLNCINVLKNRVESPVQQISIDSVVQEIENLIKSVATLYKIDLGAFSLGDKPKSDSQKAISSKVQRQNQQKQNQKELVKKFEAIGYHPQKDRFVMALDLFGDFYKNTVDEANRQKAALEKQLEKALQINKSLLEKASARASEKATLKSIKSSSIFSCCNNFEEEQESNQNDTTINNDCSSGKQKSLILIRDKSQICFSTMEAQQNEEIQL